MLIEHLKIKVASNKFNVIRYGGSLLKKYIQGLRLTFVTKKGTYVTHASSELLTCVFQRSVHKRMGALSYGERHEQQAGAEW